MRRTEPAPPGSPPPPDSVTRNSWNALATQLLTASFTAALTVILARLLGAGPFGVFSLAVGISTLIIVPVDFGISASAGRFLAEQRGDPDALRHVLADSLRLKLYFTIPASIGLVLLAGPIAAAYRMPALAWPLRGIAVSVLGQSLLLLSTSAFSALGLIRIQVRVQMVESFVETSASILLVLLGAGATGAAFGRGIGYLAGSFFAIVVTVRLLGSGILPRGLRTNGRARAIALYAGALLVVNGAYTLFQSVDILIIGAARTAVEVGYFSAALRVTTLLAYPGLAIANGVSPRVIGDELLVTRARFNAALRGLTLMSALMMPPLIAWAQPLVLIALGPHYLGAAPVLAALAPYVYLSGLAPLVSVSLTYLGQARKRALVACLTVGVNAAIDAALIPKIGIVGGAIGTDIAFAIYVPVHLMVCHEELGLDMAALARTTVRALMAAAVATEVLLAVGRHHLSLLQVALGSVAGLAVYAAVLVVLREVTEDDIRWLAAATRRYRPRAKS